LVVFAALALVFTSSCSTKRDQPKAQAPSEDRRIQEPQAQEPQAKEDSVKHKVLSFNLEGLTDRGEKKWDVKGESAEAITETEVKIDNVVANAYGEEAQAVITADEGIYDKSKNNVRLQKNVHATIESKKGFDSGFGDLPGSSAQAKKDGSAADARTDKKTTKTVITCDGEVEFDYEKNVARFFKNVHVDSEDGNIVADKMTVNLNPETKQVRDILAEGNVRIKRGENITYSDRATYDALSKKVSLVGRPKLVIYEEDGGGSLEANLMGGMKGKK
jgi:lipopolysaccharide assembly outer membrane protein LptD (OstA)